MPDWGAFAGFAGVVLALLLLLAHASQSVLSDASAGRDRQFGGDDPSTVGSVDPAVAAVAVDPENAPPHTAVDDPVTVSDRGDRTFDHWTDRMHATQPQLSTMALLANVAVSQGAFGTFLLAAAWFTQIPASAFGVAPSLVSPTTLGVGVLLGTVLYGVNEVGATVGDRLGVGTDDGLREALAPDSLGGWFVLLFVVLPIIAGFEELLFRGVLVGVFATGFGLSPWLLAVGSSVAFALGHGAQGSAGVAVTGVLGFVLAATFVLSGSLVVVIVAHYLVNVLEFVVHEGLDVDWV